MNESNFAHAGLALLAQMMTALMATALGADLLSAVVMGGLFAVGFYFGREVAQAERKAGRHAAVVERIRWSQVVLGREA